MEYALLLSPRRAIIHVWLTSHRKILLRRLTKKRGAVSSLARLDLDCFARIPCHGWSPRIFSFYFPRRSEKK